MDRWINTYRSTYLADHSADYLIHCTPEAPEVAVTDPKRMCLELQSSCNLRPTKYNNKVITSRGIASSEHIVSSRKNIKNQF